MDDFDTGSLDATRWTALNKFHMNGRADTSMAKNVSIVDGKLRLAMTKEPATGTDGQTTDYTSGTVWSRDRMPLPNYFRIQFRLKVPWQPGVWPGSLWLRPNDLSDGEIDPFELRGQYKATVAQTIHSGGYGGSHVQDSRSFQLSDPSGYHTVILEKRKNLIDFSVDGVETFRVTNASPAWNSAAFEDPAKKWFIWINLQSGGWGGLPTSLTDFSGDNASMFIDNIYTWVPTG